MNRYKDKILNLVISLRKSRWKSSPKLKVAIAVNKYFTAKLWNDTLEGFSDSEIHNWEIEYCGNKMDVYRHIPGADVCFIYSLSDFLLKQISTPKLIYFPLLGLDFLNVRLLSKNLTIEQPPPFSAQSIAEYCVAMSIILTRNLQFSFKNRYSKTWDQSNIIQQPFVPINQMKIGILGMGKIGKVIAGNFKNIGCKVIGCDKIETKTEDLLYAFYKSDQLQAFIEQIDILIISLPLNESTRHLINKKIIQALGSTKYIINVSRGEIIDEKALAQALSDNTIKGAVIDVFETEPLPPNSILYKCDNVIITPHVAGNINLFVNEIQQDFIRKTLVYGKNV
jgi:phosphoglycerate dehydrogenase-like enzyme